MVGEIGLWEQARVVLTGAAPFVTFILGIVASRWAEHRARTVLNRVTFGDKVALRSYFGRYVKADLQDRERNYALLVCHAEWIQDWEIFTIAGKKRARGRGGNRPLRLYDEVTLRAHNDRFVKWNPENAEVAAGSNDVGVNEVFLVHPVPKAGRARKRMELLRFFSRRVVQFGDVIALEAANGRILSTHDTTMALTAVVDHIDSHERYEIVPPPTA